MKKPRAKKLAVKLTPLQWARVKNAIAEYAHLCDDEADTNNGLRLRRLDREWKELSKLLDNIRSQLLHQEWHT